MPISTYIIAFAQWPDARWCIPLDLSVAQQHLLLYLGDTINSTFHVIALMMTPCLLSVLHFWAYKPESVPFDLSDAASVGQLFCTCCSLCRGMSVICIGFLLYMLVEIPGRRYRDNCNIWTSRRHDNWHCTPWSTACWTTARPEDSKAINT